VRLEQERIRFAAIERALENLDGTLVTETRAVRAPSLFGNPDFGSVSEPAAEKGTSAST
jgi:hypothetical protein